MLVFASTRRFQTHAPTQYVNFKYILVSAVGTRKRCCSRSTMNDGDAGVSELLPVARVVVFKWGFIFYFYFLNRSFRRYPAPASLWFTDKETAVCLAVDRSVAISHSTDIRSAALTRKPNAFIVFRVT